MEENLDTAVVAPYACYTPPDLQNIFLQACDRVLQSDAQCRLAWEEFTSAFGRRDPNTITANDYNAFFKIIPVVSQTNTVLFWTGVINVNCK